MENSETKILRAMFGRTLREKRKAIGLSQEELAYRASLTPRYISLLECDKRQPTISTLYLLSEGLGISLSEFVTDIEMAMPEKLKKAG